MKLSVTVIASAIALSSSHRAYAFQAPVPVPAAERKISRRDLVCLQGLIPKQLFRRGDHKPVWDQEVQDWRHRFCSIARYRNDHGRNAYGDCGDWTFTTTRFFYLDELDASFKALKASNIPKELWGDLCSEHRDTIKEYTRERSYWFWRLFAILSEGGSRTLEERKQAIRDRLDPGLSEDEIELEVSMALVESAQKTRDSVNTMAQIIAFAETCTYDPSAARRIVYEQAMSIFLLPENQSGILPSGLRKRIRKQHPECSTSLDWTMTRPRRVAWVWLGAV